MVKIILEVDGMACGMCETHVNDAVRRVFPVKKVTSSHAKGRTEILAEQPLDEEQLKAAVSAAGYTVKASKQSLTKRKDFLCFTNDVGGAVWRLGTETSSSGAAGLAAMTGSCGETSRSTRKWQPG